MNIKRSIFLSLGVIFLFIGAVGIIVPLLPTTPLVIVAAICFGKSSKKAEKWISENKYFGSYIENYKNKTGVPLEVKIKSIVFLWLMLCISIIFTWKVLIAIILLIVGIAVTLHIYFLKTRNKIPNH
jgi:uncharacterized membrane protein YbaN (DUF454 family)